MCLLKKVIYGFKQAPHAWFHKLASALSDLGFDASKSDPSLFIRSINNSLILILVYVDDIIIMGSNQAHITSLISDLASYFLLKILVLFIIS